MADKRLKLFPASTVVRVKESHPEKFSQRVATILDRYQGLLEYHISVLDLSEIERQQVSECLNGSVVDALYIDCLDQELADAGYSELALKLERASFADKLLLVESLCCDLAMG